MKKKFLSLMMAAAVIATTSVSAFADVTKTNTGDIDHEISIEGNIKNKNDVALPSTISVSVPTNTSFTVDKTGKLISGTMNVLNMGSTSIDVYAYKFNDPNNERGINIKKSIDENTDKKENVSLALKGGDEEIYFSSSASITRGIYKSFDEDEGLEEDDEKKIKTLAEGGQVALSFYGKGGKTGSLENPLQEKFTLTLKIKATPETPATQVNEVSQR